MSEYKRIKLVDTGYLGLSTTPSQKDVNWQLCVICQDYQNEPLTRPSNSTRKDIGSGYSTLTENLIRFNELGLLPRTLQLDRLNEGCGIAAAMAAHNAQYHKTCRLKFNNTKLNRTATRMSKTD